MSLNLEMYPRGFIFGDLKFTNIPPEYESVIINEKFHYSYYKYVNHLIYEHNDTFIIIHGNATFVHHKINLSENQLAPFLLNSFYNDYNKFLNSLDFIGGRYAIIIGNQFGIKVYQDATAGRSVYYSTEHNIISSHAHL